MNDYLDSSKTKYTIADVETSLNLGVPLSASQRKVMYALIVFIAICALAVLVCALVVCLTNQLEEGDESFYVIIGVVLVCFIGLLGLMLWIFKQSDKRIKQIEDCLDDAIEVTATICREPFYNNSLSAELTYVAHFDLDGVEYGVPYKPELYAGNNRKDLNCYLDVERRALYSPKRSDVLILKALPSEEIL